MTSVLACPHFTCGVRRPFCCCSRLHSRRSFRERYSPGVGVRRRVAGEAGNITACRTWPRQPVILRQRPVSLVPPAPAPMVREPARRTVFGRFLSQGFPFNPKGPTAGSWDPTPSCAVRALVAATRNGPHHASLCSSLTKRAQDSPGVICDAVSRDTTVLCIAITIWDTEICSSLSNSEFHAERLRDEPWDATATGSGSSIPSDRCQLSPANGNHEIRAREIASHFPILKKGFCCYREVSPARPTPQTPTLQAEQPQNPLPRMWRSAIRDAHSGVRSNGREIA